jgi:nitric-oxide synthase
LAPEEAASRLVEWTAIARRSFADLFTETPPAKLDELVGTLAWRQLEAGEILMSEGEEATEMYVLAAGRCGVYTQDAEHRLRLIATIDRPGTILGEQALLENRQFRNASVLALGTASFAVLGGDRFRELLRADAAARDRMADRTLQYARNKLQTLAVELAELANRGISPASAVRQVSAGTALYRSGEPADKAYFPLSGEVSLFHAGCPVPHETLRSGLLFGESEVLAGVPRRDDAIAATPVEVMAIDVSVLESCSKEGGALGTILTALASAHDLPQLGTVYRYLAHVDDQPCIVSDYSQPSGLRLRVRYFPHGPRLEAARQAIASTHATTISGPGNSRTLMLAPDGVVIGLTVTGAWQQLPEAMGVLLRGGSLDELQRQAFQSTGYLLVESAAERAPAGSEIVCACTNATAAALRIAAKRATTVEDLTRLTGAGGVCGGCRGRLPVFLGELEVTPCRLNVEPLAVGAIRATLEPIDADGLPPAKVGQYVRVEALIDGRWIGRPYTLTAAEPRRYELGVKLEHNGFFSNWLHLAPDGTLMRVMPPQGDVCPAPSDPRPLVYIVAGIGVTPAVAAARSLADQRAVRIIYSYRDAEGAAYLEELRQLAAAGRVTLEEHCTAQHGRLEPAVVAQRLAALGPCEAIVCGPGAFNRAFLDTLRAVPTVTVAADSFDHPQRGEGARLAPGAWRKKPFQPALPAGPPIPVKTDLPLAEQAAQFVREFYAERPGGGDPQPRIEEAQEELARTGAWRKTPEELGFAARIAWRNAERCVGRLYWKGLHLRDCRQLEDPDAMAEALFEHLRFAWNGGDLRPAITVFDPGNRDRPGPRIWNPQLLRYAGLRLRSGRQIGDPAQNGITERIMALGWQPAGTDFDLLPLVIETPQHGAKLYELPEDCRREIPLTHPHHPWLAQRGLKWYAIPAVADMALDAGGVMYRFIPFNGWYLETELAARNFTDSNRYNLLPDLAERMGLDISNERTLWRDKAMLMLHEAVLHSYDRAGVKIADHHTVCHEFLEFCRNEQAAGREPYGKWMWLVPPFSSSATALYQEPFRDKAFKPAYRYQKAAWERV